MSGEITQWVVLPGVCRFCAESTILRSFRRKAGQSCTAADQADWSVISDSEAAWVLCECLNCAHKLTLAEREFQSLSQQLITSARLALNEDPGNLERQNDYLVCLLQFDCREAAGQFADIIQRSISDESIPPQLQASLCTLAYLEGDQDGFEKHFKSLSLCADQYPIIHAYLAWMELMRGDPEAAFVRLRRRPLDSIWPGWELYLRVATWYWTGGFVGEAIQCCELAIDKRPALRSDPMVMQQLEKYVQLGKGHSRYLSNSNPVRRIGRGWKVALAIAVLLVCGLFGCNEYLSFHFPVWVVNGLPDPIEVKVDQQIIVLGPGSQTMIDIAEGKHQCQVVSGPNDCEPFEFEIHRTFQERFGNRPLCVLDPTESCQLVFETQMYGVQHELRSFRARPELHLGNRVIQYPHVRFPFQPFPKELDLKSGELKSFENRFGRYGTDPADGLLWAVSAKTREEPPPRGDPLRFAERQLIAHPKNLPLLRYYAILGSAPADRVRCLSFLRSHESSGEEQVLWLNTVIGLLNSPSEFHQYHEFLTQEIAKNPESSDLYYLRARTQPEFDSCMEDVKKSIQLSPANTSSVVYGYSRLMATGRYADAHHALRFLDSNPHLKSDLSAYLYEVLLAMGRNEELRSRVQSLLIDHADVNQFGNVILMLEADRNLGGALDPKELTDNLTQIPEDQRELLYRVVQLPYLVIQDDFTGLANQATLEQDPAIRRHYQVIAELGFGRVDKLEELKLPYLAPSGFRELVFALAFAEAGDQLRFDKYLQQGIARLHESNGLFPALFAKALENPRDVTRSDIEALDCSPIRFKPIFLCLLVELGHPERDWILDFAKRLNYHREFPGHFVARQIERQKTVPANGR